MKYDTTFLVNMSYRGLIAGYAYTETKALLHSHVEVNRELADCQAQLKSTAKALGDLQRNYAAAVGDFLTINGALQLRNGELVRKNNRCIADLEKHNSDLSKSLFRIDILEAELKTLRPPEPLFKVNEVALLVNVTNGTTLITSRRFTADGRWEYQNGYSKAWYTEAFLQKLSEENKG